MTGPPATGAGGRVAAVALAGLVALACYANTTGNAFVFDDLDVVTRNPLVTGVSIDVRSIFSSHYWAHVTPAGNLYRPLAVLSYALNHRIAGLDPATWHAVNIFLHALCSSLAAALALRLGLAAGGAMAAGAIFAAHPVHTEAVAAVVGRADLLAAAAVMGAWLLHLSSRRPATWRVAFVAVLFAAGLLSKESAVVLPGLMLLGDMWRVRTGRASVREARPAFIVCLAVAAAWLALRWWILPAVPAGSAGDSVFAGAPASARIPTALSVMGRYLWLLLVPVHLSADYSFAQIPAVDSFFAPGAFVPLLIWSAIGLAGVYRLAVLRVPRLDGLGVLVIIVAIAPVSNLLVPIGTIMGERLLYLPSLGLCLALPPIWADAASRRRGSRIRARAGAALALLLVGAGGARTIARNADWKDQITLFEATTAASPRSAKARFNLGVALEESGRPGEALEAYFASLAIREDDPKPHYNAGLLLAKMDRHAEALSHLERAAHLDPDLRGVSNALGVLYSRIGRHREAEEAFRNALARDPAGNERHVAHYNLGTLLLSSGRVEEAILMLEQARADAPSDYDGRYQLGLAYLEAGRPRDAADEFEQALSITPSLSDARVPLARALLRDGDREGAAAEARRAREEGHTLPPDLLSLTDREERGDGRPP